MQRAPFVLILALLGLSLGVTAEQHAPTEPFDVLIRNGRVMDGTGNPWLRADVAVRDGRIAAVGALGPAQAKRVIDAADRLVTPGFIDVHTHAVDGLARPQLRQGQPLIAQGITTVVGNPDGGGPVDLAKQRAALETGGLGPNVALLIGHGSVRAAVLGPARRDPTPEELERMRALVRRAMEEGAYGLSSGLFYTPGSFAKTEEVIALAAVAGEYGGVYTSHVRDEADYSVGVLAATQEVIRIAEEGRLRGIVSHMKALGPDQWGLSHAMTRRIEEARARGVQVFADQYAYDASSTSLRAALLPGGAAPSEEVIRENMRRRGGAASLVLASYRTDRSLEGRSLADIAALRGTPPERTALDLLAAGDASIVSFNMAPDDIDHIMRQPYTMTSSDGGLVLMTEGKPHPRNYGAFSRKLRLYVGERQTIGLEAAIRSMTSLPASVFGFKDRGVIREGAAADINVFDPAAVKDRATYADPHQLSEGMSYVLVNGVAVIDEGTFTSAMPGRVLLKSR